MLKIFKGQLLNKFAKMHKFEQGMKNYTCMFNNLCLQSCFSWRHYKTYANHTIRREYTSEKHLRIR